MFGILLILGGVTVIGTAIGVAIAKAVVYHRPNYSRGWKKSQIWDP